MDILEFPQDALSRSTVRFGGAEDYQCAVGVGSQDFGVGDQQGGTIEDDIIIHLFAAFHKLMHTRVVQQFGRIGRQGTAVDHIQPFDAAETNDVFFFGTLAHQIVAQSEIGVFGYGTVGFGAGEQMSSRRSAQVGIDQQNPFVFIQHGAGQVDRDRGFAVACGRAGDQQDLVVAACGAGQFQVGPQLAIIFAHNRIRRLANHVCQFHLLYIFVIIRMTDGAQQRCSQMPHDVAGGAEQVIEQFHGKRQTQTGQKTQNKSCR